MALMQVFGVEIPTRCFVGGLPYSMTELELNTFFSQFGTVKDSKIITDRNGVSKGYGFVTYQTEQEAAGVCSKGSLYYKEKKLNISKAIRRQGGQYAKANQEYVNGQRMLYQSSDGYLMTQKNGSWIIEDPSPFCQPAKPCFQILSPPPPVFVGAPNTAPYLQSPVTPTYYPALSPATSMSPYEPLPPLPPDLGPLLYCDIMVDTAPLMPAQLPPQQTHHMISHTQSSESSIQRSDPQVSEPEKEEKERNEEEEEEEAVNGDSQNVTPSPANSDSPSVTPSPSVATTPTTPSLSLDLDRCSLSSTTDEVVPPSQPIPTAGPVDTTQQSYHVTYQCSS